VLRPLKPLLLALLAATPWACADDDANLSDSDTDGAENPQTSGSTSTPCVPGESRPCNCDGQRIGTQVCLGQGYEYGGCVCDTPVDPTTDSDGADPPPDFPDLQWGDCPVGFIDECAYVPTALSWDDPGGVQVEVLISRRRAPSGTTAGQLWMLQGGPGGSANVFGAFGDIDTLGELLPDVEIYTMEHRGVADSVPFYCPNQGELPDPMQIPACAQALEAQLGPGGFEEFSTRAAAQDLDWVTRIVQQPGVPVFIYGVSYGTYVAQRYLQLFPEGADGVILDSVVTPGQISFDAFDPQFDHVGQAIAAQCALDETCRSKLGDDPWATVQSVFADLEAGSCPQAINGDPGFFFLGLIVSKDTQDAFLPLVYRLGRCDPGDLAALDAFNEYLGTTGPNFPPGFQSRNGELVGQNISTSELWDHSADLDELDMRCEQLLMCPGAASSRRPWVEQWPRYSEPLAGQLFSAFTPVLAMNGTLDPQTPIEQARLLDDNLVGPAQNFVEFPDAPHGLLGSTPMQDPTEPACGFQVIASFVRDPGAPPDDSCVEGMKRLDVTGDPANAMLLFGVPDLWENPDVAPAQFAPHFGLTTDAARRRYVEQIRRRLRIDPHAL
jgi:pimeloyl-ACP methyl ester carboxylesterase